MKPMLYGLLAGCMGLGAYALVDATMKERAVEAAQTDVPPRDDIHCRAKFANWLMRFEELSKPEKERWASFRGYMGQECVK